MKNLSLTSLAAGLVLASTPIAYGGTVEPAVAQTVDRSQTAHDHDTLEDRVLRRLETNPMVRKYDIDVDVAGNVVTLSGEVATAAQKAEAERLAKIDGVSRVDSRIDVDADADKTVSKRIADGFNKAGEKITDGWITTKVNWFFIGEDLLEDSEIDVETKDQVVTLKGFVKSTAGRARAVELAKATDGVKDVVDQLQVQTSR